MGAVDGEAERPEPVPLVAPREGLPPLVSDPAGVVAAAERLAAGTGPVAVDAERASGFRYSGRAYLVQLRREGAGTVLVDPAGLEHLLPIQEALADVEWVLHAASQDLSCLAELGMRPSRLFDTELGGRLAGFPRVGLGPLTEQLLGVRLDKEHGAADWSRRPIPEPLLRYAALDVELLVDLRDEVEASLREQGKLEWAHEEFAALVSAPPAAPRVDPWRRTSGLHKLRDRRQLAVVRALWHARDDLARERDVAPGRVLPDAAILDAARTQPGTVAELTALPVFGGRATRRDARYWHEALAGALALADAELPRTSAPSHGPPTGGPSRWADRDPEAAERLRAVRAAVAAVAEQHAVPAENLLAPEAQRRLAWEPPPSDPDAVAAALQASGARSWQVALTAAPLAAALAEAEASSDGAAADSGAEPV